MVTLELTVVQLINKFPEFYKMADSSSLPQESAVGPYPETDESPSGTEERATLKGATGTAR
jgi:hypothetical protein